MSSSSTTSFGSTPTDRALVLGGGGSVGNAWLIGVIAGLFAGGVDLTRAGLIVGTSAGATAAVQITGASPADLLTAIVDAPPRARPAGAMAGRESGRPAQPVDQLAQLNAIIAASSSPADLRRRLGAAVLESDATSDGSASARWRATVAARLPSRQWPEQRLLITAVDAVSGEPVVLDRDSGIDVADAVAASTSNGFGVPPYRIGEKRLIDGGYRRNENADLARGYARVLVLSPLGGRTLHPLAWGMQLSAQVDELRASGTRVETVVPDAGSIDAFGDNLMDLSRRAPAARAGYAQGEGLAAALTAFWS